jgi:phosphate uptake regulator
VIGSNSSTLQNQRERTAANAEAYHALVANINSRLQIGTTPSNPILVNQWNQAQGQLDQINADVGILNQLSNDIASNSSMAAYILETVRATYGLGGAVDEDHQQLAVLEDEVNKTVVSIDRLLNELSEDIRRQSSYVGRERSNLTTLSVAVKNGEMFGSSLQNQAFAAAPLTGGTAPAQLSSAATGRPLVVIRFDNPNVQYEEALYTAMSRALERRPTATFELVAVAPTKGSSGEIALASANSKRQAEQVLRSLTNMGLPADRISLSATTSSSARSNEVHIYVR